MNKGTTAVGSRAAGEEWGAVSSTLVIARLKWPVEIQGAIRNYHLCISKALPSVKTKLSEQFQDTLDRVPNSDFIVLLCDFNERVGVFNPQDDLWHGVVGKHKFEDRNFAGEKFLQFCECKCHDTCFQKKPIHYGCILQQSSVI